MRKKALIALGVLAGTLMILGLIIALQPSTYSVRRSTTVNAPPARLFAQVNDLKAWDAWSPWSQLDPDAKTTLSAVTSGKGATIEWSGNDAIGEGRMTILESKPDELVEVEQVFVRPLEGTARLAFNMEPEGAGTKMTFRLDGQNGFLGKALCLCMDMDAMIGADFEKSLANMKAIAEKAEVASGLETTAR